MAEKEPDAEFVEVNVEIIWKISGALPFDIYIKRAEGTYTKLFPKGEEMDEARLIRYQVQKGIQAFSVHREDYRQYIFYVERLATNLFHESKKVSSGDIQPILDEMIHLTSVELLVNQNVDEQSVKHASQTVQGCVKLLSNDPKKFVEMFRNLSRHPYNIKHAMGTSMFALLLAKAADMRSEKAQKIIGMGGLLHDIGVSRLSYDAEQMEELTPEQWKEMKEHPELGKRLLDAIRDVPSEVRLIVLQHHEQINGLGYPNGLNGQQIYPPAKIVSIADSFSALLSKRPYRPEPNSPLRALEIMHEDRGKFDQKFLELFTNIFVQVINDEGNQG